MFKEINLITADEDELLEIIAQNIKIAEKMQREISKLQTIEISSTEKEIIMPIINQEILKPVETVDTNFENEIDFYLTEFKKLTNENINENLLEALPVPKNFNYKKILLRLKAECLKNIKEIKELLDEEKDNITIEIATEFKDEILFESKKINLLNALLNQKENTTVTEENIDNKLIFIPTSGGNIRVLDEIEHIPVDYYDKFLGLFNSIKDGTFKNVKRFKTVNNENSGICEVKDHKIRVVFDRISKDSYAIITAFLKKSDNDYGYREQLNRKINEYRNYSNICKDNIEKQEYLDLNKAYEESLFSMLKKEENRKEK